MQNVDGWVILDVLLKRSCYCKYEHNEPFEEQRSLSNNDTIKSKGIEILQKNSYNTLDLFVRILLKDSCLLNLKHIY